MDTVQQSTPRTTADSKAEGRLKVDAGKRRILRKKIRGHKNRS